MSDKRTSPLVLDAMIVTGNTKAAVKAAGGGSSDLWTVPPEHIHYDPRDNVRPLNKERVRKIADLIKANGYDRKKPLGCFVRKVGGEDRIFVYEGQHRYHGALLAISEGYEIDRLPLVIDEAKSVTRANLIYAGVVNNDSEKLTPLQLAEQIVELQALGEENKTICARLNITDQTIRDCLLLAKAPAAIHKLVREQAVTSTLAIEQIRAHGPEKALERLQRGIEAAKATGKAKATKKHVEAASAAPAALAPKRINDTQAKQLLQALQSVLHDPLFGKLSPGTIEGVHTALEPLTDLLDALPSKAAKRAISMPNEHGVYTRCETIKAPLFKRSGRHPYEIHLAHIAADKWIFSTSSAIGTEYRSSPCALREGDPTYPTRGQAIRAAVSQITLDMQDPRKRDAKEAPGIHAWLNKLYLAPDPDWTEALATSAVGSK
ncbi:transcriptional regulator [Paraburkholderia tropica]|uniref:transcriptional regulator n=1 Tax=Paraburkholderia tropica TaxID=92647 RepID=UPI00161D4581|nr:transcriptional regulator [Paraburkholderia tropica]MBB6319274.1 ParB-like chromosome segregation protein Spo0J [Paraburkholderia tropica]